jgi:hypothetical protein
MLGEQARAFHAAQDVDRHEIAGAEIAVDPLRIAELGRYLAEPLAHAILDHGHPLFRPGLVLFEVEYGVGASAGAVHGRRPCRNRSI